MVAGLVTNVYVAVVARALPPASYAVFGSFWATALVLGFGAFLPVEQELARRLAGPRDRATLLRAATATALLSAALACGVLVLGLPVVARALGHDASALLALVGLCVVSAGQFLLRGILIGTDRLVRHAGVMVLDALLRLVLAVVLWAADASAALFCWGLVVAIALAHLPQVPAAWRRALAGAGHPGGRRAVRRREFGAPVLPLLLGSMCAQLLLNGVPVLVTAAAGPGDQAAAGVFVAAFTLAKAPLSVVVPLQSAVVPTLTRLLAGGRRREVIGLLVRGAAALGTVAVVVVPLTLWVGPAVITLVLGPSYVIGGALLAVLVAGVLAHLGLVVVTQVHVARGRHRDVAASWVGGLAVGGIVFVVVPSPIVAGGTAFAAGSLVGAVLGCCVLLAAGRRPAPGRVPRSEEAS